MGLKVKTKVEVITEGEVYREIMGTEEKEKVYLIVMGERGKREIKDIIIGGVYNKVESHKKKKIIIMRYK